MPLNALEEKLSNILLPLDQAKIYWDADQTFQTILIMMLDCFKTI
jgi:hypothetical protein